MTVRIYDEETSCTHTVSNSQLN